MFRYTLQVQTNDNINWAHLSTHPLFGPSSIKWKWKAQDMLITWKCIYRLYGVTHDEYHSRLYYLIRPKLFCCFDIQTCIHMHTNIHTHAHQHAHQHAHVHRETTERAKHTWTSPVILYINTDNVQIWK